MLKPDFDYIIQKIFAPRGGELPRRFRHYGSVRPEAFEQTREPDYERTPRDFGDVRRDLEETGLAAEQILTIHSLLYAATREVVAQKSGIELDADYRPTKPLGFAFQKYASGLWKPLPFQFMEPIRERFAALLQQEMMSDPWLLSRGRRGMEIIERQKRAPQPSVFDRLLDLTALFR